MSNKNITDKIKDLNKLLKLTLAAKRERKAVEDKENEDLKDELKVLFEFLSQLTK